MRATAFFSALLATAFLSTSALALTPGQYKIGDQTICLKGGTTKYLKWYSPSYAGWGGRWKGKNIFGNYDSGAGNDTLHVDSGKALWFEWRDDLSTRKISSGVPFIFVKLKCDPPPPAATTRQRRDPAGP